MSHINYEKQFVKALVGLLLACSVLALIFVGLSIKDYGNPLQAVVLDGQTLASYLALVLGTAVAFAGSWVAIRIAQAANFAQQQANDLQKENIKVQDPNYIRAKNFTVDINEIRFNLFNSVLRISNAINAWEIAANSYVGIFAQKAGIKEHANVNLKDLPSEIRSQVITLAFKQIEPFLNNLKIWGNSDVIVKINAITPLMLLHISKKNDPEGISLSKKWLQGLNAFTFSFTNFDPNQKGQTMINLVEGVKCLEAELNDPQLTELDYVLGLVHEMTRDAGKIIDELKRDLGFAETSEIWKRK